MSPLDGEVPLIVQDSQAVLCDRHFRYTFGDL